MKIGLMNNPSLSIYEQVEAFGKAGYDFLDFTLEGPMATFEVRKIERLLGQYGLDVVGHTDPCLPWAYPVKSVRNACFKESINFPRNTRLRIFTSIRNGRLLRRLRRQ